MEKLLNNEITKKRAAKILDLSIRRIEQLMKIYDTQNMTSFAHHSRGRTAYNKTKPEICENILNLYKTKYIDFNFIHFKEKLLENEKIKTSYSVLYNLMSLNQIKSPRKQKLRKKDKSHPLRERRKYFGELLQADASEHLWLGINHPKIFLHGAIDDATNTVVGLYFDYQETLNGYYNVLYQILKNYGIPMTFYTDKRTFFTYQKNNSKNEEKDTFTQFSICCNELSVEIITTSIPQAKGWIERLWGTSQDRLKNELGLAKVTTLEEANKFLKEFLPKFNKHFALPIDYNNSFFVDAPESDKINLLLSITSTRRTHNGSSISYANKKYLAYDNKKLKVFNSKTNVTIINAFDKTFYLKYENKIYNLLEYIPTVKNTEKTLPKSKAHKPKSNHPWTERYTMKQLSIK
nr:putative transposase of is1202 family protein [Spiroplasma citri]